MIYYVGIRGNELVDSEAKDALNKDEPLNYRFPFSDYIPIVKSYIRKKWQERWDYKHNNEKHIKLHDIMPVIKPFYLNGLSRKSEIILHRLRIGHTRMTHKYLMDDPFKRVPPCNFCYLDTLSVKHILIECQHFAGIRPNHYIVNNIKELFENILLNKILSFLREANLYKDI